MSVPRLVATDLDGTLLRSDGSVSPRTLGTALTDRLAAFTWDGVPGYGIFEFAVTRSRSYAYRPTPADGDPATEVPR